MLFSCRERLFQFIESQRKSSQEKQNFQISVTVVFFAIFSPHLILRFVFCRSHIFQEKTYFHIFICICLNYAQRFFRRLWVSLSQNLDSKFQMDRIEAQFLFSPLIRPPSKESVVNAFNCTTGGSEYILNFILKLLHWKLIIIGIWPVP